MPCFAYINTSMFGVHEHCHVWGISLLPCLGCINTAKFAVHKSAMFVDKYFHVWLS